MNSDKPIINWEELSTVKDTWALTSLISYELLDIADGKIRAYSLNYKNLNYNVQEFIESIKQNITSYVLNQRAIDAEERAGKDLFLTASKYFGKINPQKDGKFGELILYLLIESVLRVPMIALKLTSSPNDQVKGSDGIFCGNYLSRPAILIGEAKVYKKINPAINSAFRSLNRFYQNQDALDNECLVARQSSRYDCLSNEQMDYIYDCLTIGSEFNLAREVIHPVLIIYDSASVVEAKGADDNELISHLKCLIHESTVQHEAYIVSLLEKFSAIRSVDFFFIPMESVDVFRNAVFKAIHGFSWQNRNPRLK